MPFSAKKEGVYPLGRWLLVGVRAVKLDLLVRQRGTRGKKRSRLRFLECRAARNLASMHAASPTSS
jgi:hypothetical protein